MFLGVYPRVYGGTFGGRGKRLEPWGLSPRVRGNQIQSRCRRAGRRSIPACTGEPLPAPARGGSAAVYPRVYGGTYWHRGKRLEGCGLSPRVRGNPHARYRAALRTWSIPACTGEPALAQCLASHDGVYPRVYGGTMSAFSRSICWKGLSPRVRGNRRPRPG